MKKKRYFPFGYRMAGGQIEIVPEESSLLQNLFDNYLKGASLIKGPANRNQIPRKYRTLEQEYDCQNAG